MGGGGAERERERERERENQLARTVVPIGANTHSSNEILKEYTILLTKVLDEIESSITKGAFTFNLTKRVV